MIKASPLAAKLDVIKNVTSQEDILLTPEMLLILAVYAHPENEIANELQKLQNRDVTISYNDSCYTIFSIDKVATASRGGEGEVIKRGSVEALNFNNHYGLEVALSVVFREVWEGGLNASFEYKRYSKTLKAKAGYIKDSIDKEYISNSSGLRSAKDCYFSYYFKGRHSKLTSYQAIFHP